MANVFYFGTSEMTYNVIEGTLVQLSCTAKEEYPVIIYRDMESDHEIVRNWTLLPQTSVYDYKMMPDETDVIHILTIQNVNRTQSGSYGCLQTEPNLDQKTLILQVIYQPSQPTCETGFHLFTMFTTEKIMSQFEGKCVVTDGYPPAEMSFSGIPNLLLNANIIHLPERKLEGSLSFLPSVTLNNSAVSCIVRQDYPSDLNLQSYEKSCSFEPFQFWKTFEVWITPPNLTVHRPGDVSFICSSNAGSTSGAYWLLPKLPSGVSHTERNNKLTLHVQQAETLVGKPIVLTLECRLLYRNMSSKDKIFVTIDIKVGTVPTLILIIIVVTLVIFAIVIGLIFTHNRKRKIRKDFPANLQSDLT